LRTPLRASCIQCTRCPARPRVNLRRQKSVATHTSSDTASEKISKLPKLTHERLTEALLRRPLPPYAAQLVVYGPNEMLSHHSMGHLDAITELSNSDNIVLATGSHGSCKRTMDDARSCSRLHDARTGLCCGNRNCRRPHARLHASGSQLPTGINTILWCCPLTSRHASHFERRLPSTTSCVL